MPSFRRRASVIDTDGDKTPKKSEVADAAATADPAEAPDALSLAEQAEAEAAEAEAVAAAARARARAIRLRREAAEAESTTTDDTETTTADDTGTVDQVADETETVDGAADETGTVDGAADGDPDAEHADAAVEKKVRRKRVRRPGFWWKLLAALLCVVATIALIVVSVWMFLEHKNQQDDQRRAAEYSAAARQGVVTLMSLDFNKADEDVQRIIDNTTGQFRDEFQNQAQAFAEVARQSKVITEANVNIAAVKDMDEDSAVVLVSATSHVTNSAGANREPRSWRLLVDLQREGDQIKMSKVEFVP